MKVNTTSSRLLFFLLPIIGILCFVSCRDNTPEFLPVAKFSIIKIENEKVEFRNNSINATEYEWDFGDGMTSTETEPVHIYSEIGNYQVTLTAKLGDKTDVISNIAAVTKIYPDELTELGTPPFGSKTDGLSFTWEGKGYVGFGSSNLNITRELWRFDSSNNSWTQMNDAPKDFVRGVSFVINGAAYFGLGQAPWGDAAKEFYKYDIATDTYSSIGLMPLNGGFNSNWGDAVAFASSEKGYVVASGASSTTTPAKVMEYNPLTNNWTEKSQYPGGGISGMVCFMIDGNAYVGLGDKFPYSGFDPANDFWKYNVINDTWTQVGSFPDQGRRDGIGFSNNGKGYIAFGYTSDLTNGATIPFPEIWEYDVIEDSWSKIESMPISIAHHPYHFVLENKLYFGGGSSSNHNSLMDFYEYVF